MSEWWTYRAEDFLLFSETVYWRLFELQNRELWPAPLVAVTTGLALLAILARRIGYGDAWAGGAVLLILSASWSSVALSFFGNRYSSINFTAEALVLPALLQAALLAGLAAFPSRAAGTRADIPPRGWLGLGLCAYAVLVHPLLPIADGRPLAGAELLGLAPDPTAVATLGALLILEAGRPDHRRRLRAAAAASWLW